MGADPSRSWAMVEAAIRQLEIELVWLPAGDPALKGALALFDEQSGTICFTEGGDVAKPVELIAHEIGHACIHATSSHCTAHDIDASRSTEAAPVGLQRVEDYGTHERRELQANVFAREFLLPRAEARRLHLTGTPRRRRHCQWPPAIQGPGAPAASRRTPAARTHRSIEPVAH